MAKINRDHSSYQDFTDGLNSRYAPLSAIDKKILEFALRSEANPVLKTHGQIVRNFGMYPPEFWLKAQNLSGHPDVEENIKKQLSTMFPKPSRPGPMGGGAPVKTDGKSFSHGLTW